MRYDVSRLQLFLHYIECFIMAVCLAVSEMPCAGFFVHPVHLINLHLDTPLEIHSTVIDELLCFLQAFKVGFLTIKVDLVPFLTVPDLKVDPP